MSKLSRSLVRYVVVVSNVIVVLTVVEGSAFISRYRFTPDLSFLNFLGKGYLLRLSLGLITLIDQNSATSLSHVKG